MMAEKAGEAVDPAVDDRDADTEDQTQDVSGSRLLDNGRDTDNQLDDIVDARNKEKDDLKQSRQMIECFHEYYPSGYLL